MIIPPSSPQRMQPKRYVQKKKNEMDIKSDHANHNPIDFV